MFLSKENNMYLRDKCKFDMDNYYYIYNDIKMDIERSINNIDDILKLLESELFLKKVKNFNKMILSITFDMLECGRKGLGVTNAQLCDNKIFDKNESIPVDFDRISKIVIMYKNEFDILINKIMGLFIEYTKLCKGDPYKALKIRKFISAISLLGVDNDDFKKLNGDFKKVNTDLMSIPEPNKYINTFTFFILFILGFLFGLFFYKFVI